MRGVITFLASLVVHALVATACLAALLRFGSVGIAWIGLLYFLVVACLSIIKAARWHGEHTVPFGLGLSVAAIAATFVIVTLMYGLTHPVGPAPPFGAWTWRFAFATEGALWLATPLVLAVLASVCGHRIGFRLARANSRVVQ